MKMKYFMVFCCVFFQLKTFSQGIIVFIEARQILSWDNMNTFKIALFIPDGDSNSFSNYCDLENVLFLNSTSNIHMFMNDGCIFVLNSCKDSLPEVRNIISKEKLIYQPLYWKSEQYITKEEFMLYIEIYKAPEDIQYKKVEKDMTKCPGITPNVLMNRENKILYYLGNINRDFTYVIYQ